MWVEIDSRSLRPYMFNATVRRLYMISVQGGERVGVWTGKEGFAMMRRVFALFLAGLLTLSVAGCGKSKGPEDTLDAFQEAFNRYDLDAMLDCVEPTMAALIRALLDSEGRNYSMNHSLIFALIKMGFPLLPMLTDGAIKNEDLPKLSLEYGKASQNGDESSVPVEGSLTVGKGFLSFRVTVKLKRDANDKWVITGLEKAEELDAENVPAA